MYRKLVGEIAKSQRNKRLVFDKSQTFKSLFFDKSQRYNPLLLVVRNSNQLQFNKKECEPLQERFTLFSVLYYMVLCWA